MRIIIMKADANEWYKDLIGKTFDLVDDTGNGYIVKDKGQLKRAYKKDCEVI